MVQVSEIMRFVCYMCNMCDYPLAAQAQMYELPYTGGAGPMVVTAIGIGLAVLSLLLFVLRGKSKDDNKKDKPSNQIRNQNKNRIRK